MKIFLPNLFGYNTRETTERNSKPKAKVGRESSNHTNPKEAPPHEKNTKGSTLSSKSASLKKTGNATKTELMRYRANRNTLRK